MTTLPPGWLDRSDPRWAATLAVLTAVPTRRPEGDLHAMADRLHALLSAEADMHVFVPDPEAEQRVAEWRARVTADKANQGEIEAPLSDDEREAVQRWRAMMAEDGITPEPEPKGRTGRPPRDDITLLLEAVSVEWEMLTGRAPGGTGAFKGGLSVKVPSPSERFAMALLGIYGLPAAFLKADGEAWATRARTSALIERRKTRRFVRPSPRPRPT